MPKPSLIVALVAIMLSAGLAAAQPAVQAVRAATVPALDGKLDDACWAAATPCDRFLINNTDQPAQWTTSVRVLFDDTTLYVGARCAEPDIASLKTEALPRDNGDVFRTDCLEVMLDPAATQNDYFHIGINASGTIADRACTQGGFVGDMTWDSHSAGASFIGPDYWSCELAIPFAALAITPQVGDTWRLNVCREKKQPAENSSLAAQGAFNIAARFIELRGLTADLSRFRYRIGAPVPSRTVREGKLELTLQVPVTNMTGQARPVIFDTWLTGPSGRVTAATSTITPPVDREQAFTLGPITLSEQGDHEAVLRLADPVTKQPLAFVKAPLGVRFVPLTIRLLEPWYRNCLFATQGLKQVVLEVDVAMDQAAQAGCSMTVAIAPDADGAVGQRPDDAPAAKPLFSRTIKPLPEQVRVSFDAAGLPEARMAIVATLSDAAGKQVASTAIPLRKLPRHPGEVWLGRDMQWYVEGQPFFLNGAWNYAEDFIPEYNAFTGEKPGATLLLDTGIMNDLHYKAKSLREAKLSEADALLIREWIRAKRDNPKLFGYYTSDEPECSSLSAKALEEVYQIIADEDPYHPVIISNDSMEGLKVYARCADINGLHPYPVALKGKPINDLKPVTSFVEGAVAFFADAPHKQTVAYLHQGFNYGDYGAVNNRIPNYLEYRNQNLLALICGARGTIQFNRMVAHYPELYLGMPYLTKELAALEPIMTAPAPPTPPTSDSDQVKLLAKVYAGHLYVLACNADLAAREVKLTLPGVAKLGKQLQVVSEGRTVALQGEAWTDSFGPYECHIYTTAPAPKLATVKQIVAEIAAANAARRKPGNLAFQEFEGDGVVVSASSSYAGKFRRPDNGLWHVVDGVVDTTDHYKVLTWRDDTPDQFPDWLEVKLPQAQKIGRVVVYPFAQSLQDAALEVFDNGQWREVGKLTGQKADPLTFAFAPVTTDRLRVVITATHGPNAIISEVEVYPQ